MDSLPRSPYRVHVDSPTIVDVTPDGPPPPQEQARSPEEAALELYDHARALLDQRQGYLLGTKNAPSEFVRDAQRDMNGIVADGIYGPGTRARGRALTGKLFPIRK